jgi:site-specific recombinase XerD
MSAALNHELLPYKEWLGMFDNSPATVQKYLRDADRFLRFSGKSLSQITKQDVLMYKDDLIKKYRPVSVNSYLISLHKLFFFLQNDSLRVKTLRIQRKTSLTDVLSGTEYASLLECARSLGKTRLYYIMRVLASSGIRVSELRYITPNMLKSGKTYASSKKKVREIIIPNTLCAELERYCAEQGLAAGDSIFHGKRKDTLIDKSCIWREMKALALYAGVPQEKVHAQNFRHLFAQQYLARFHDIVDLADILGHSSVATTRIYTQTSGQEKQARINTLNL